MLGTYTVPARTTIGHVHLKVSDLERSVSFYRDVLGFTVQMMYGTHAAFLSAGGYHHHLGLNTWESAGAEPAPRRAPGLYHVAILLPEERDLALALRQVLEARVPLTGASDHGVSKAVYLDDPDGNGIELYWDRPKELWPTNPDGTLTMYTRGLDLDALLALAP
jgi:catechol 2,3-dioxygenase